MAEEEEKHKEKRFPREFVEKYSKASEREESPEEAILEKQKALLEKDPTNTRIWHARGLLLMDMGRDEEALECLDRVVALDPDFPGVWNARAEVLRKLGRVEEAAESLRKALLHVAPQVDERFRELLVKKVVAEEVPGKEEEVKRRVEKERPPERELAPEEIPPEEVLPEEIPRKEEAPPEKKPPAEEVPPEEVPPEEKAPPEAPPAPEEIPPPVVEEAVEELESLKEEEVPPVLTIEEKEFKEKIEAWEQQGYDVTPLRQVLRDEPYKARTAFFQFEQNIAKIAVLRETLDVIKTPGFEKEVERLRTAMKSPYNIWKVEADMGDLLARVEAKQKEIEAEEVARQLLPEIPPPEEAPSPVEFPVPRAARRRAVVPRESMAVSLGPLEGRTNGLMAVGRVNGLVNGLQSAKRGLTNGLTDATGLTNGLGFSRFTRETKYRKWKMYIIPLVVTFLLFIPLLNAPMAQILQPSGGIAVDGNPSDWSGISGYTQTQYVPEDNVNITGYKSMLVENLLSVLVQVKGTMFGDVDNLDSIYTFIDGDGKSSTGYNAGGMGADFMVEVTGNRSVVANAYLSAFRDANPGGNENWSAWTQLGGVYAASAGSYLEFQLDVSSLRTSYATFDSDEFQILLNSDNNQGTMSSSAVKMGASYGALLVRQEGGPSVIAAGGIRDLLTISLEAVGSVVRVNQLDFAMSPQTVIVEPPSDFDVTLGHKATVTIQVNTQSSTNGDFLSLEVSNVDADRPVSIIGEAARAYIGSAPAEKRIDGVFADWSPSEVKTDVDSRLLWPADVDITQYGTNRTTPDAFFFAEVRGSIMAGSNIVQSRVVAKGAAAPPQQIPPLGLKKGEDILRVYIDSNSTDNEGTPVLGLRGADYMVEVRGMHGRISKKTYHQWSGQKWQQAGAIDAEKNGRRIEIGFNMAGITANAMQAAFESSSWKGIADATEVSSVRSRSRSADGSEMTYKTLYGVTLPTELSPGAPVKYMAGAGTLEWSLPKEIVQVDGESTYMVATAASSTLVSGSDWAKYVDAYNGISADIEYIIAERSLKEQFVFNSPLSSVLPSPEGVVRLSFKLKIGDGLMTYVDGSGPEDRITTSKPISFLRDREEEFSIPPAVAWDSEGRTISLPYVWEKAGPTLSVEVPVSYLLSSSYPVCVDPWVNWSIKNKGPLNTTTEQFGYSVAIGDFNNDGYADLLTGAWGNGKNYSLGGAAYIYLGPLTSNKDVPDVNFPGTAINYRKGTAVAAGKFNDDVFWDALVTQYPDVPALIYYGKATWPKWVVSADVTINAQSYGLAPGFPRFGWSAAAGNFDNAMYDDIVISAPWNQNNASGTPDGAAFVFLSPFSSPVTNEDFTLLPPTNSSGLFGRALATGKVDGDSNVDIVVGEPNYFFSLGRMSFFKGSSLSSGSGVRMPNANVSGKKDGERFGWSVAVGKLNSDIYEDIAVGAPWNGISTNDGMVYLYLASSSGITTNQAPSATVASQSTGEQFGTSVLIGPVIDTNPYNLVVGAPYASAGGTFRGRTYFFETPLTSSSPIRIQSGDFDNEQFGSVLAGGKFASDSFYRVAVGDPRWPGTASALTGRVVIFYYVPEFEEAAVVIVCVLMAVFGFGYRRRKATHSRPR